MKPSIQLEETSPAGDTNPLNRRFFADGKRVSRDEFDAIKRDPRRSLECMTNANQGGVMHFYSISRQNPIISAALNARALSTP